MKKIVVLLSYISLCFFISAQYKIDFGDDIKIKKEGELFGVKKGKTWTIPPHYNKIEGFGGVSEKKKEKYHSSLLGGVVLAFKGAVIDIYEISYGQKLIAYGITPEQFETWKLYHGSENKVPVIKNTFWSGEVDVLNPKQIIIFSKFKAGIYPYIKNNKWGFATKYNDIKPQFDSLFPICRMANGKQEDCTNLIGVKKEEKLGIVQTDGTIFILEPDFVEFKNERTNDYKQLVYCKHKSGGEITFSELDGRLSGYRKMEYLEVKGHNGLIGYATFGEFVEPLYTEITLKKEPFQHYLCKLPNGSFDVRIGAELKPNNYLSNYIRIQEEERKWKLFAEQHGNIDILKTKNYQLNIYPSWTKGFSNTDEKNNIRSNFKEKRGNLIFAEAPDGWLKNESYIPTLQFKLEDSLALNFNTVKKDFVDLALYRSKAKRENIKITEEILMLPNGQKAQLLFSVIADGHGMVDGCFLDCQLAVQVGQGGNLINVYTFFSESVPAIAPQEIEAWKNYFKNMLISVRPR